MSIFARRPTAPQGGGYQSFRAHVREDFSQCCAYCLFPELLLGGPDAFDIDHFKPQSIFPDLIDEFFNLYYSCHICNRYKSNRWITGELAKEGFGFVDPCKDRFDHHYNNGTPDGRWQPVTNQGEYMIEKLRLNSQHRSDVRRMLDDVADRYHLPRIDWNHPAHPAIEDLLKEALLRQQ